MTTDVRGEQIFHDPVSFGDAIGMQAGSIGNTEFSSLATKRLASGKVVHRVDLNHDQAGGSNVVAETKLLRIARGIGTLLGFEVRPITAPTGGDLAYTVDIQKAADGSGSYSTLLDTVVTVDNTSVDETKQTATLIADPATAVGDCIRIVIALSGSTGSQGQGVIITAAYEENPS